MKRLYHFFRTIFSELVITALLVSCIAFFLKFEERIISADGVGYYDYLPSVFIHKDFIRKDVVNDGSTDRYNRVNKLNNAYNDYNSYLVNTYPVGTAILQLPFFVVTNLLSEREDSFSDGYQAAYHNTVLIATIFYLFLGLIYFRRLLLLYDIKKYIIIYCQIMVALATSVLNYCSFDASFSHVYSFFAVTSFLYFSRYYFKSANLKHFVCAAFFLGLVLILRNINLLILLFIPFLSGSFDNFSIKIRKLIFNGRYLLYGIAVFFIVISLQLFAWYLQTGHFFVYSYKGLGSFDFSHPHFLDILFSYKKGLFIYTPITLIASISMIWFGVKKRFFELITWVGFFAILTYVLSSWFSWYYGCSYGLRAYVDFYAIFFVPFAVMLNNLRYNKAIMAVSLIAIPVNIIQTYQYKEYILHWIDMDKKSYWEVFLRTGKQFKGLLWKQITDKKDYILVKQIGIDNIDISKENGDVVFKYLGSDISDIGNVSIINISFSNDFNPKNDASLYLYMNNNKDNSSYVWVKKSILPFYSQSLGQYHKGEYDFVFKPTENNDINLVIHFQPGNYNTRLDKVIISLYRKR